jgi:hypothetical protein
MHRRRVVVLPSAMRDGVGSSFDRVGAGVEGQLLGRDRLKDIGGQRPPSVMMVV